jgi:hypothetical protein
MISKIILELHFLQGLCDNNAYTEDKKLKCNIIAFNFSVSDGVFDFSFSTKKKNMLHNWFYLNFYFFIRQHRWKASKKKSKFNSVQDSNDHGCDIFTSIFTSNNISRLLIVGDEDFFYILYFFDY